MRCLVESYATCCEGENEEPAAKRPKNDKTEVAAKSSADSADNERNKDDFKPVAGIVIALCCHHKCDWTHYVGREFFKSVGLGPVEFHYFQRMSSWATCGMRETITSTSEDHTNNTEEHDQPYSKTESGFDTLQGYVIFFLNIDSSRKARLHMVEHEIALGPQQDLFYRNTLIIQKHSTSKIQFSQTFHSFKIFK